MTGGKHQELSAFENRAPRGTHLSVRGRKWQEYLEELHMVKESKATPVTGRGGP
jgi:hypothetical protein